MSQSFEIPGRLDGMNEYTSACRTNAYKGAKMKRDNMDAVSWAIRSAGLTPMDGPVEIGISWIEGRKRNGAMRDIDNIRTGAKWILDALVECKVLPDDNPRIVRRLYDNYRFNASNPHIEVLIEEYDPHGRTVTFMPISGIEEWV